MADLNFPTQVLLSGEKSFEDNDIKNSVHIILLILCAVNNNLLPSPGSSTIVELSKSKSLLVCAHVYNLDHHYCQEKVRGGQMNSYTPYTVSQASLIDTRKKIINIMERQTNHTQQTRKNLQFI